MAKEFELEIYYPKESELPLYKETKPFSERKPTYESPWSEESVSGIILDEIEHEEYVTWPNGAKKVYKHVIQLIHWDHDSEDRHEIRIGYYKTDFEDGQPTTWNWGQYAPSFKKEPFLRLMAKAIATWII
ncbi:MAG: hypothetical protein ACFFC7_26450 [Candidatus Hermodarchaeota archaeon]